MTTADDALFEPLSGPISRPGSSGILSSGISKQPNSTIIEVIPANPKHLYTDAAHEVIDLAVRHFPQLVDVRATNLIGVGVIIPPGAYRLDGLVERFHDGDKKFWVACPGLTPPRQFEFAGRFGHYKVWRLAQKNGAQVINQFTAEWFWVDSTEGRLSAIELGMILLAPGTRLHHVFGNQLDAQSYYVT